MKVEFFRKHILEKFMKVHPVRAEFFHTDRRTHRQDEANSHFSQFCEQS